MYNSKFPQLVEHLIDEHQLLLLDSEIQLIDYLIDKDLKIRKMKDNNILIAEFMGYEKEVYFPTIKYLIPNLSHIEGSVIWVEDISLKFHNNWQYLIPVIQEIERRTNWTLVIAMGYSYFTNEGNNHPTIEESGGYEDIKNIYDQVINFIHWYNNQKSNNNETRN